MVQFIIATILSTAILPTAKVPAEPVRIGVVGLVHTHVHWILGRQDRGDIEIVGIVEPNRELAQRYSELHGYSMDIVFDSMQEMVTQTKPEAVTAFNTIYGHLEVVQYCAPRGIHVMVEKPLAVSLDHALEMEALANEHNILLLTNFETSWYASNHAAKTMLQNGMIGNLNRIVFNTGHPGPIEIGCNPEFLEWLTDPVLNGGGALTDFGCYGSNVATWISDGQTPEAITCVTRNMKPDKYPNVEDDATVILDYAEYQVVIQASWNWSHNRKDMTIYGDHGYIECTNGMDMVILLNEEEGSSEEVADALPEDRNDPFSYMAGLIRNQDTPDAADLSALANNMTVMRILEGAKVSAAQGCTVTWKSLYE